MWVGDQRHATAVLPPRKQPVPIVQEAGWASGLVWTSTENLTPTRVRAPNRQAHSEFLYWLYYPSPLNIQGVYNKFQELYFILYFVNMLLELWYLPIRFIAVWVVIQTVQNPSKAFTRNERHVGGPGIILNPWTDWRNGNCWDVNSVWKESAEHFPCHFLHSFNYYNI